MTRHEGGCLCGKIRYATQATPVRVTVCHCKFCQKATGSAYMVEPIFEKPDFALLTGSPKVFDLTSAGSGKIVHIHFCGECSTKLWLSFERFPDLIGIYAGTYDDPCWFPIEPENSKQIYLGVARKDSIIPAGIPSYVRHATTNDGTAEEMTMFDHPHCVGG